MTSWTVAHQAPLSMGLFRQEYWSGLPFPLPGDLSDPRIKPLSLVSPTLAGRFFTTSATWESQECGTGPKLASGSNSELHLAFLQCMICFILYFWHSFRISDNATSQICIKNQVAAAAVKLLQSCPTLCDPIDSKPPGSPVPGILQARTLEWVAIAFSEEPGRSLLISAVPPKHE